MKSFFISLGTIFSCLFFGTMLIVFILGMYEKIMQMSIVGLALLLVAWQGWISFKQLQQPDTKQEGIGRILGILVGLFVWYSSCGGLILGVYF
ncbi:MAG: hypothetical protein ACI35O_01120 [Bacillaceae bacterium]